MALTRDEEPMPHDVDQALAEHRLREDYDARPAYQRNDYLRWVGRAARTQTREARIEQMLTELRAGGVYMGMEHPPSRRG